MDRLHMASLTYHFRLSRAASSLARQSFPSSLRNRFGNCSFRSLGEVTWYPALLSGLVLGTKFSLPSHIYFN